MYLTYEKYIDMGGVLDEAAFKVWSRRAERKLNYFTFDRLKPYFAPDAPPHKGKHKPHEPHCPNHATIPAQLTGMPHRPHSPHEPPSLDVGEHNPKPEHGHKPDDRPGHTPIGGLSPDVASELGAEMLRIEENTVYEYNPIKEAAEEVMFDFIELMSADNSNSELTSYSNGVESFHFNTDKHLDDELYNIAVEALPIEIISTCTGGNHHHGHFPENFHSLGGIHGHGFHC